MVLSGTSTGTAVVFWRHYHWATRSHCLHMLQEGASFIFPDFFEPYETFIPAAEVWASACPATPRPPRLTALCVCVYVHVRALCLWGPARGPDGCILQAPDGR